MSSCAICLNPMGDIHDTHNGEPYIEARVCSICNDIYVIPMRLKLMIKNLKNRRENLKEAFKHVE